MTKMEADHAKEDPFFVANREREKIGEIGGRRGLFFVCLIKEGKFVDFIVSDFRVFLLFHVFLPSWKGTKIKRDRKLMGFLLLLPFSQTYWGRILFYFISNFESTYFAHKKERWAQKT